MKTAEQNYRLLQEIEESRMFMLMAYRQNPKLLERADSRVKQLFEVQEQHGHDELGSSGIREERCHD